MRTVAEGTTAISCPASSGSSSPGPAGSLIGSAPTLLLFLALQRYYIEGITMGGVKE